MARVYGPTFEARLPDFDGVALGKWHHFRGQGGPTFAARRYDFLWLEHGAIPEEEVSGWSFAETPFLGQSPVWCLAPPFNPESAGTNHHYEAVVLQFVKPPLNAVSI